jgi:hypothetical protein
VKGYQEAHVHRILNRVRKHGGGGLQRNEDGNRGLRKTEVQKLQNSQSIKMLITYINTISQVIKNTLR